MKLLIIFCFLFLSSNVFSAEPSNSIKNKIINEIEEYEVVSRAAFGNDVVGGDSAYDIIIVLSHNVRPTIKNKGSAIFIHCSFSDFKETAGCVALKKRDLTLLLKNLSNKTRLDIKNNF